MKLWEKAAAVVLGIATIGELCWLCKEKSEAKKVCNELERQHQEIEDFIAKEEKYLASIVNGDKPDVYVELEDGTKMEFGEYLDLKLKDMELLETEDDLQQYLEG